MAGSDSTSSAPAAGDETREGLPCWDLTDLYSSPEDPEITVTLERCRARASELEERWRGRLAGADGDALAGLIAACEETEESLARILSYAHLRHASDLRDPLAGPFLQNMLEQVNAIAAHLLFVELELRALDDERLEALYDSSAPLAAWRPWLRTLRLGRAHQLDSTLEHYILDQSATGPAAWIRLFDETMAGLRFDVDGRTCTESEVLTLLSDPSAEVRRAAGKELARVLRANIRLLALVFNNLVQQHAVSSRWRRYPRPDSRRHQSNQVDAGVVDVMVGRVREAYPRLSHRYYHLKARLLGLDGLDWWDRQAPLPGGDRRFTWHEARDTVMTALADFSPGLAEVGERFFRNGWIDASPRPGKAPGAFAHPCVPSVHPWLLLNFHGRTRDVMTLAHELGHGIHQCLAASQGHLISETPLILAETASVFCETIVFHALLSRADSPEEERFILAGGIEDRLGTVVRQISFYDFERQFHDMRAGGELTPDEIGRLWREVGAAGLGSAVRLDADFDVCWSYVPHFIHTPFYVYAYAFGNLLVGALWQRWREGCPGFIDSYTAMLASGGRLRYDELLATFGLDPRDPAFWECGLEQVEELIDRLGELV